MFKIWGQLIVCTQGIKFVNTPLGIVHTAHVICEHICSGALFDRVGTCIWW